MGAFGSPLFGSNRILLPGTHTWVPRNIDQRRYPPNQFNACLDRETELWKRTVSCGNLMAICPGKKRTSPPWLVQPADGRRFNQIGSTALVNIPPGGGDVLITSYLCPLGSDGVIKQFVFNYTGPGFQEGSGELVWRVQKNMYYANDLGNYAYQMGSLSNTSQTNTGDVFIKSGMLVQIFARQSATSGLAGGRVVAAMKGWTWPR